MIWSAVVAMGWGLVAVWTGTTEDPEDKDDPQEQDFLRFCRWLGFMLIAVGALVGLFGRSTL